MASSSDPVIALAAKGMTAHDRGRLTEASTCYRQVLQMEPPAAPSDAQSALVLKFAPRLHTVPGEYFPLKDVVAVLHPDKPVIGYHLFWEDDIDYPDDNQPCDHEVIWVVFSPLSGEVVQVISYLHGRLVTGRDTAVEANGHGGRPWIGVEWGKHGSVPWGASEQTEISEILRRNWEKLHHNGRRLPDHPLSRGWPLKFPGDYAAYLDFSVPTDPVPILQKENLVFVSRWPNAVINLHCLRYNFSPKTEWPSPAE